MKYFVLFAMMFFVTSASGQHSVRYSKGVDAIEFTCVNEKTVQISYLINGKTDSASVIIDPKFHPVGEFGSVDSNKNGLQIQGKNYSLILTVSPLIITMFDKKGEVVFSSLGDTGLLPNSCSAAVVKGPYYGLDNRPWGIMRYNWSAYVYSSDWGNASGLFTWTTNGLGILADVDEASVEFDGFLGNFYYRKEKSTRRNNVIYLMVGSPREIFSECAAIIGKPPMPPLWSLGFIHSKWKQTEQDVFRVANQYRNKDIPVDAFAFDYEWLDWGSPWGEFKWNPFDFPSAQSGRFADSLSHLGISLMGIRKPRIHYDEPQGLYARAHGYFMLDSPVFDYVSIKRVAKLNFFNPDVRKWFWDMTIDTSRNPLTRGIKAFWNDEVDYKRSMYGTVMQQAQYEGQRSYNNDRVFSLNRNYFIGANRFAYGLWSGDIPSNFQTLAAQRTFVQNSACIGDGWWSMDIGGYLGAADSTPGVSEMYIRWIQLGAFVPFFRIHSVFDKEREPWFYGVNAERICTEYIRLRYMLLPYTYGTFRTFVDEGLPPVRPFIIDHPNEDYLRAETRAFQFGPSMVVAPIVDSLARTATFYLPSGQWVNFWNDSIINGGSEVTVDADLEHIPILIKKGAIIPERDYGRFALDTNAFRDIRFHIYGSEPDSMSYYEDDFTTYDYEKSNYAKIPYSHSVTKNGEHISIGKQIGSYTVKKRRGYFIFHCFNRTVDSLFYNNAAVRKISSDSIYHSPIEGWALDTLKHILVLGLNDPFKSGEISINFPKDSFRGDEIVFANSFDVSPNPTLHSIHCSIEVPNDEVVNISIVTEHGVDVFHKTEQLYQGKNLFDLGAEAMSAGSYFITVQGKSWKKSSKVILLAR